MKKITLLLSLLFMAAGAEAKVITTSPVAGTPYTIRCQASDHPTGPYLADDGSTLQGRYAAGTNFVLESTGTDGQYYLKSAVTDKYVNASGVTGNSAVTFDTEAKTYWTLGKTNVDDSSNGWLLLPNGTDGVSLNNNGAQNSACPWMKINTHNNSTQNCNIWLFDDNTIEIYQKPAFGGTVWTWNTATDMFDAEGHDATATPGRLNNKGPVYKFVNVGTVTTHVAGNTDTSDDGGVWVSGSNSNVTSSMGRWAGSILVESGSASLNYSQSLKGTEADGHATVWADGTLSITDRQLFDMNDGGAQRWYIGENGVINTGFNSVSKGGREWNLQVIVTDQPEREGHERVQTALTKTVMTWSADIFSQINSIAAFYKDAAGNLTRLPESAVSHNNTGITVSYTGLGYDEKTPSLPEGKFISVSSTKADFLTVATNAADNDHWYLLTQTRGTDGSTAQMQASAVYDNGANSLHRANNDNPNGKLILGNEKYLVRFFHNGEGTYDIQFATGNYVTANLTTGNFYAAQAFNLYNISDNATHIGWNKAEFGSIVDNNGAGNDLSYWETGRVTDIDNNNDWSLYSVSFIDGVNIDYTLHSDVLNRDYKGSYVAGWAGDATQLPAIVGAAGATIGNAVFTQNGDAYKLTADITFPFPVSSADVQNATGIQSELGNSKWYATADNIIRANNAGNTTLNYQNQDDFKWYIYPGFADGEFSYKIKHNNGSYIPVITSTAPSTPSTLTDEASAGVYYFIPCVDSGNGFSTTQNGPVFLSINSSGTDQNIFIWTKPDGAAHKGSNLTFPDVTITVDQLKEQLATLKAAPKFDILEGSTVTGPSEIAAPAAINAAIDAAEAVNENELTAIETFLAGNDAAVISDYLAKINTYGELFTYHLVIDKIYSTLMIPCPSVLPEGLTVYTIDGADGAALTQTPASSIAFNVPYVVESKVGNKYTIIGWLKAHPESTYVSGWLTGVYSENGMTVPDGAYVFSEDNSRQAFVKVNSSAVRSISAATCAQYQCYLTPAEGADVPDVFYLANPGTTQIVDIQGADRNGADVIFDLQGRRVSKAVNGIYIVNGKKVFVK